MYWELRKKLGKAQARDQLPQLVEALQHGGEPVAITDYGKPVAVILGFSEYTFLLTVLNNHSQRPRKPVCKISGDLEQASKNITAAILASIEKTAGEL